MVFNGRNVWRGKGGGSKYVLFRSSYKNTTVAWNNYSAGRSILAPFKTSIKSWNIKILLWRFFKLIFCEFVKIISKPSYSSFIIKKDVCIWMYLCGNGIGHVCQHFWYCLQLWMCVFTCMNVCQGFVYKVFLIIFISSIFAKKRFKHSLI